jgi:LacI family transcriptional regulator
MNTDTPTDQPRRAGKPSVTVRDVARLAGVSVATVSNVLNQPDIVASRTRDRVERAIVQLNFVPNSAARHLAAGRSKSIGLVLLDLANPYFLEVARGVEDVAADAGYVVMLFNSADSPKREDRALRVLLEQRVSGVLMSPVGPRSAAVSRLRGDGINVVLLDRKGSSRDECSVAVDDLQGGQIATEHLLAAGHRQFVFVGGASHVRQHAARLKGARLALRNAGVDDDIPVVREDMTLEGGRRAAQRILGLRPRPTAILCGNDLYAVGVEQVLLAADIAVPTEIAIVGYDDVEMAAVTAVPLTSVQQPMYAMGRAATELLISEIEDPAHQHERVQFIPRLVPRASSQA